MTERGSSDDFAERLAASRILPVVVLDEARRAGPLAAALGRAGVRLAEVTLRTPRALRVIEAWAADDQGVAVGAGTVLTGDDVDRAADAGARFVVSPGLVEAVVRRARERGVAVLPGVATATEVQRGLALGLSRFKFFPAEASGGAAALRAFRGPFPEVSFVPTGGVTPRNARAYVEAGNVAAVGGSWMVPPDLAERGDLDEVARRSAAAREALRRAFPPA